MSSEYDDVLRDLWQYHEFQVVFHGLRYALLAATALLVVVALLHLAYMLGFNSPLYSHRSPRVGWTKRFLPAVTLLIGLLVGLFLLSGQLIARAS